MTGPWQQRFTTARLDKANRIIVNSVVSRSADQHLTTAGTNTEMISSLLEPILLARAVLAVRGRIKR